MTKRFHGVTSLVLVAMATLIAIGVIFWISWVWGIVYLAVCAVAPQAILRAYCARCPCREHCAHLLPGQVVRALTREPGPYTSMELTIMSVSMLIFLGLPQVWLWQYTGLFVAYWVLNGVALFQIRLNICPGCENAYCPLKAPAEEVPSR